MKQTITKAEKKPSSLSTGGILQYAAVQPLFNHKSPLMTSSSIPPQLQAKLKIAEPNDQCEQEADRIAAQVMRMPEPNVQRKGNSSLVFKEEDADKILQAKSVGSGARAKAVDHPLIQRVLSLPGHPLDAATLSFMEPRFGQDFSRVRVHVGSKAAESARTVNAQAYTVGRSIVFGAGYYEPRTGSGKHLIAHELTHVMQQNDESRILRDPLASKIPPQIELKRTTVRFTIPGNKAITGDWNDVSTTDQTTVTLTVVPSAFLSFDFTPPFLIDVQYPWSDIAWSSVKYDFTTRSITARLWDLDSLSISALSDAESKIRSYFTSVIHGTPLDSPGYNPLSDPDLVSTLESLKRKFLTQPSSGGNVAQSDVQNVALSFSVGFLRDIKASTDEGGITIPAGGSATIEVSFSGSPADINNPNSRQIRSISIYSNDIILQSRGVDILRLKRINIHYGGRVFVSDYTALGDLRNAQGKESFLRFIGLLAALSGGRTEDRIALRDRAPNFDPETVRRITVQQVNQALTSAVMQLLRQHHDAVPGFNLYKVFGITLPPGDYPQPSGENMLG